MAVTVKQIKKGKVKTFCLNREEFAQWLPQAIARERAKAQALKDFKESEGEGKGD